MAILLGLFTSLPIERMEYSDGALREGLLYEFEERLQHHDIRERTALALSTHYRIDKRQATRVEAASSPVRRPERPWEMPEEPLSRHPRLGGAAARDRPCHQLQRHPQTLRLYLAKHRSARLQPGRSGPAGGPGALSPQGLKLSELPALPNHDEQTVLRCIRILRLAVAAHHRRQDNLLPEWNVQAAGDQLVVTLPWTGVTRTSC